MNVLITKIEPEYTNITTMEGKNYLLKESKVTYTAILSSGAMLNGNTTCSENTIDLKGLAEAIKEQVKKQLQ